jgi:hypothetical protein
MVQLAAGLVVALVLVAAITLVPSRASADPTMQKNVPMSGTALKNAVIAGPISLKNAACGAVVVEAHNAATNAVVASAQPAADAAGTCRYSLRVPADEQLTLSVRNIGSQSSGGGAGKTMMKDSPTYKETSMKWFKAGFKAAAGTQQTVPLNVTF